RIKPVWKFQVTSSLKVPLCLLFTSNFDTNVLINWTKFDLLLLLLLLFFGYLAKFLGGDVGTNYDMK
ncbi:MAG: hypothetical protein N7Q72_02215, partial [Spiroplasma sp. Tabriz.8]|nr:hypothetical protein [Spiroplasma sp. Tabriz.8]